MNSDFFPWSDGRVMLDSGDAVSFQRFYAARLVSVLKARIQMTKTARFHAHWDPILSADPHEYGPTE